MPKNSHSHALVTGGAGFIGSHVVDRMLAEGWRVTVIDNLDPFYDRTVKEANTTEHLKQPGYHFIEGDIRDAATVDKAQDANDPFQVIVHLAAKAGVRPSIADPLGYNDVNVTGTLMLLEAARRWRTPHFVLASSSSVYGEDPNVPWQENACIDRPISPYAATKLMAESYARTHSRIHGMRITALRFFTVFGPRQRPDLAIHRFVRNITDGEPIMRFGDGSTRRDYTFIGDIVNGVMGSLGRTSGELFEVYNLGNSGTVTLNELIAAIEDVVGHKAIIDQRPEQPGDVPQTFADVTKAGRDLGFKPSTPLREGLERFHAWFLEQRRAGVLR